MSTLRLKGKKEVNKIKLNAFDRGPEGSEWDGPPLPLDSSPPFPSLPPLGGVWFLPNVRWESFVETLTRLETAGGLAIGEPA